MKSWSLTVLFLCAAVICFSGCGEQTTKSDPAFTRKKAPPAKKKDQTKRTQDLDFGI